MYSILIKINDKSYIYYTNPDGTPFAGDSSAAQAKVTELLETYPKGKLVVVHNVNLTADFTLEDVI